MIIIGAGMSGLLAGQYFRHLNPMILEKQAELPNNHHALLRFRSGVVSGLTGIPFREVHVQKMISFEGALFNESNIMLNNLYSKKVSGKFTQRSISNMKPCQRYVAPSDFISKCSQGLNIRYGAEADIHDYPEAIISTMPVHELAKQLNYNILPELDYKSITVLSFDLDADIDVYQTVYYPNRRDAFYRVSITGRKVIAEMMADSRSDHTADELLEYAKKILARDFGIRCARDKDGAKLSTQKYGKLVECETNAVRDFIGWASKEHNIYSLGRWGTHRQLLMDDVVADLTVIDNMIRTNGYKR